jgi:hypothetical protein
MEEKREVQVSKMFGCFQGLEFLKGMATKWSSPISFDKFAAGRVGGTSTTLGGALWRRTDE